MQAYRRQVGFEDEDELMQYAIQQSLIETGTENDEVHEKNVGLLISLERAFMDVFFGAIKIPKLWVFFLNSNSSQHISHKFISSKNPLFFK